MREIFFQAIGIGKKEQKKDIQMEKDNKKSAVERLATALEVSASAYFFGYSLAAVVVR